MSDIHERIKRLPLLLDKISPIPAEWYGGEEQTDGEKEEKKPQLEPLPCTSWKVLINSWRKAMKWTDGLDVALSVMLASAASTMLRGDQLWVQIISPPATGKSTLCEALAVSTQYTVSKSTFKGFFSGYQTDKTGKHDSSLIAKLRGKTFIVKDGDTLLRMPNKDQVLSEARDIYDTVSRSSFKNQTSRDYSGIRMTWILCGTGAMRELDSAELGARFLTCIIMETIDPELEDIILWKHINKAANDANFLVNGKAEEASDPTMIEAMRLTGGYLNYLRDTSSNKEEGSNAFKLTNQVKINSESLQKIMKLGKLVAYMRARPSKKQDESAERELSTRLCGQLVKLAKCLGAVLQTGEINQEILRRIKKVALDTARGNTLDICRHLYQHESGLDTSQIAQLTHRDRSKEHVLLNFLRKIEVVEKTRKQNDNGTLSPKERWKLTWKLRKLYKDVVITT